jgi:isopentenyldiphosphate isomerase
VQEETGYKTECPELIYTYNPMNGMSNKVFHIVRCKVLQGSGKFDQNEVKDFEWCSVDEIRGMIAERKIKDGFALTALLLQFQ